MTAATASPATAAFLKRRPGLVAAALLALLVAAAQWRPARAVARVVPAALLALLVAAPAWSQSPTPAPVPEASSAPVRPLADSALLAQMRAGGLVIYFRHTATDFSRDDRAMRDFDDCENQRPLTSTGQADAAAIGAHFKRLAIPVGRVLASPYCRTREVAERMFGRYERADAVRGGPADAAGERYAGLKSLLSTPPAAGANLVISSHANPMRAVAGL